MKINQSKRLPDSSALIQWADRQDTASQPLVRVTRYLLRLLIITAKEFKKNELSLRSGALTYTVLLSLVPMLAMSTAIVKGLGGGDQLRQAAYTYIETLEKNHISVAKAPSDEPDKEPATPSDAKAGLTSHLRSAIDQLFDYVDNTNFATLGTIGVVGILLSVVLVLSHIETAMNAIWKVSAGRSILRKISDYLTLLILMPLSINVAFAASAFLANPALATKIDLLIPFPWLQALLLQAVPVFFIALTFYLMYIFFPNTKVKTLPAVIGSTLAAILWFGVQNIYISLQVGVANYNAIYGSFATLPLFLVWMYLGWIFILAGAQVAFTFQNVKAYTLVPLTGAPSLKLGAAFDIMEHIYSAFTEKRPLSSKDIIEQLPQYQPKLLEKTLDELKAARIIHASQSDERLLPRTPLEQYDRQAIVNVILGSDAPSTSGGKRSLHAIKLAGENSNI